MIISNGKFNNNKENIKNNYSIETLISKEKWLQNSKFYSVFNDVLNENVLCLQEENNKINNNIDGLRNSTVKLARIICEEFNALFNQIHNMQSLTKNSGYIEKLSSIKNLIGSDILSMKNIYKSLSGYDYESSNGGVYNHQGFCFEIIKALDKVGQLIKNILRLNKLIDSKFINKELDSIINDLFAVSNILMQIQLVCFK